ncbi:MAG: hypothetical protein NTZ04_02975 [Chloroflexi bacterium]|nr:hypothetical protein [Chloroflexota bacterium]
MPPGQEQVVGGVGRWGRLTGTQGRLIAEPQLGGWEETADEFDH